MKIGVTFDFLEYYLPTKRHKIEQKRKLVTCRKIEVRYLEEKDFPVALKVTDFDILPRKNDRYTFDTIEVRWDGKKLYKEARSESGNDKGELYPVESFLSSLRNRPTNIYDYQLVVESGKEYVEGSSIIVRNDMEERLEQITSYANAHVIFDNKVWEECGQPYYRVQTFGLGNNHGGTSLFIEWTVAEDHTCIPSWYYLATERQKAISHAYDVAEKRGDTRDMKELDSDEKVQRNIQILIPEAYTLTRNLESDQLKGYFWNDDKKCYIKEYGPKPAHAEEWAIEFRYKYENYTAILYTKAEDVLPNCKCIWLILGQLVADIHDITVDCITKIVRKDDELDMLSIISQDSQIA